MTQPNPNNPSPEMIEAEIFRFLDRKYVQTADERQSSMGLQYMEAETHDLARQFAKLYLAMQAQQPNPSPEKIEARHAQIWDDAIECAAALSEAHDHSGDIAKAIRRLRSDAVGGNPFADSALRQAQQPNPSPADELTTLQARLDAMREALERIGLPKDTERNLMSWEMRMVAREALAKDGEV